MKNIEFRIWDRKNKKFLNKEEYCLDFCGGIIFVESNNDCLPGSKVKLIAVNPNSLIKHQFIGIYDSKGNKIFEGDIVKYHEKCYEHGDPQELTAKIVYDKETAAFGLADLTSNTIFNYFTDMTVIKNSLLIVGNIFENSDLIK